MSLLPAGFRNDANTLFLARFDQHYGSLPAADMAGRSEPLYRVGSITAGAGPQPVSGYANGARNFPGGGTPYALRGRSIDAVDSTAGGVYAATVAAFQGDFTFEIMIRPTSFTGGEIGGFANGLLSYLYLYLDPAGKLAWCWTRSDGNFVALLPSAGGYVALNTWQLFQLRATVTSQGVSPPGTRLRTLDFFKNGALVETFTGQTTPAPSSVFASTTYWHFGTRLSSGAVYTASGDIYFRGDIEAARLSSVARSDAELLQSWEDFQPIEEAPETEPTDAVAPVVDNISPSEGSVISPSTPISFDVTDNLGRLGSVRISATFQGTDLDETVAKGSVFSSRYEGSSRTVISNGYRYTLRRRGGWPGRPTIDAFAVDLDGNEV